MVFSTTVHITPPGQLIRPADQLLFVGSCFADGIGQRFLDNAFRTVVNPYGTMYNPVSVRHSVERHLDGAAPLPQWVFLTLGTNHVYRLKATGQVVDNCEKRPQRLFAEEALSVDECAYQLQQTVATLRRHNPDVQVVLTVSPIRYAKYGFHESQLSKATLLLAAERLARHDSAVSYFPAYELLMDELRDYRFYKADMLHPSEQAVDYIWERLQQTMLSAEARQMLAEWQPIRQALQHRPLHPDSDDYRAFALRTRRQQEAFAEKYHLPAPTPGQDNDKSSAKET